MNPNTQQIVTAALDSLGLRFYADAERVCLDFRGAPAAYHICIREIEQPALLWLRIVPNIWVEAGSSATLALLAAINARECLVKCGRDLADGEVYIDVELPLYDGLTPDVLAGYLSGACGRVTELITRILRVQWGGASPADVLTDPQAADAAPASRVQQEVGEIIDRLEGENS